MLTYHRHDCLHIDVAQVVVHENIAKAADLFPWGRRVALWTYQADQQFRTLMIALLLVIALSSDNENVSFRPLPALRCSKFGAAKLPFEWASSA